MARSPRQRHRFVPEGLARLEERQLLAALVVTNDLDSGPGSLRQAINDANSDFDPSTIEFAIEGEGIHTIHLSSGLPGVLFPLAIDATTQPGYAGTPLVAIDGSTAGSFASGLAFSFLANSSSVTGLGIERFGGVGIAGGVSGLTIRRNFIGVDPTGAGNAGNGDAGIRLSYNSNMVIGGDPAGGNVIGNNRGAGIVLTTTDNSRITHNFIGTDTSGQANLGNGGDGILLDFSTRDTFVGSNLIANNGRQAIEAQGAVNTVLSDNITSNNETLVANVIVTASSTAVTTTTGPLLTFTYTLTNQGPHEATNVNLGIVSRAYLTFFDFYNSPAVIKFVAASTTQGSINPSARINDFASQRFAQLGTLAPGASAVVTLVVQASNAGVDTLDVKATSDQPSTDPGTTTTTTITANAVADLAVTALPPPAFAKVGAPLAFTFLVTNRDTLASILPTIALDLAGLNGASIVSVSTSLGEIVPLTGRTDFYTGVLSIPNPYAYFPNRVGLVPGGSATITVVVIPRRTGPLAVALASSSTLNVDPDPTNNLAGLAVSARLSPTILSAAIVPGPRAIRAVTIGFDAPLTRSKALRLGNYHLSTAGAGMGLRAATYDQSTNTVTLRLTRPISRKGPAVRVRIGGPGLTAPDGSTLLGGTYSGLITRV